MAMPTRQHAKLNTNPLTERQRLVCETIDDLTREYGCPPSVRDLMKVLEVASPNGVRCHMLNLVSKGYVKYVKSKARSWRVTEKFIRECGNGCCPTCGKPF